MIFATFFSYGGKLPRLELELLQTFQQSLHAQYANARLIILTDSTSAQQFEALGFDPFPIPVTQGTLLLDRVRGFRSFLDTLDNGTSCAMLDFDMLVMKPFDFLDQEFEVAYTLRQHLNKQPLNGGIAIYRATRASKHILDQVIEDYKNLPHDQQRWWGDQISISNLFREKLDQLAEGIHSFDGAPVLLLDAKKYNFTPYDMDVSPKTLVKNFFIDTPLDEWLDEPLKEKFILHFKGPRKHLQFQANWQLATNKIYSEHVREKLERKELTSQLDDDSYFEKLVDDNPKIWETNDLFIMALLSYDHLNMPQYEGLRGKIIKHLRAVGDFRVKVIMQENYAITQM